ncbi:MAG: amino acid ABC transporter permease [Variovorax sp.]
MENDFLQQVRGFFSYANVVFLMSGMATTLLLSLTGCVVGFLAGFTLAATRKAGHRLPAALRIAATIAVEAFRRVPFLVTLLIVFFAFQLAGANVSVLVVGIVSVSLIATGYLSEIIRAGIDEIHPAQWDSAAAANFTYLQTLRYVVMPQAWRVILPPAFAFFVMFLKDSALASQIGVVELTYVGKVLNNKGYTPALTFGSVLVLYFVLSYPLSRLGRALERRLAQTQHR